jgi:hypothetical protein
MRALCGSIITAGAMIGLGLTALGYGIRYQSFTAENLNPSSHLPYGQLTLAMIFVVLLLGALIGLGIAFLGLAFHHHRRQHEMLHGTGSVTHGTSSATSLS